MKLIRKIVAVSSFMIGSALLTFAVSNLEFQEYSSSPLIDYRILTVAGIIAYIPFAVHVIREELYWHDNH